MGGYYMPESVRNVDCSFGRIDRLDASRYVTRLRESEHRHRNHIAMIRNLVHNQLRQAQKAETRESLGLTSELIDTLAALDSYSCEDCGDSLAERLRGMGQQWQRLCNGHIKLTVETEDLGDIPLATVALASTAAQELVLNAIKHAFPLGRPGAILISLEREGPFHARLRVEDDGIGLCEDRVPDARQPGRFPLRGQVLVTALASAMDAELVSGPSPKSGGHAVQLRWKL